MSRSGYCDDIEDNWRHICWRGAVASAIRGKRGQGMLIELRDALDAMPNKRLVADNLQSDGDFCALGVLGAKRGIDMTDIDPGCAETVASVFGIADAMAREIVYENDEWGGDFQMQADGSYQYVKESPEHRWARMRNWVESNIKQVKP
jgi:hypothetical protein